MPFWWISKADCQTACAQAPILTRQAQLQLKDAIKEERRLAAEKVKADKAADKAAKAAARAAAQAARAEAKAAKQQERAEVKAAKAAAKKAAKKTALAEEPEPIATPLRKRGKPADVSMPAMDACGDDGAEKPKGRGRGRRGRGGRGRGSGKQAPVLMDVDEQLSLDLQELMEIDSEQLPCTPPGKRPRVSSPDQEIAHSTENTVPEGAAKAKADPTPKGAPKAKAKRTRKGANPTPKGAPKAATNPTPEGALDATANPTPEGAPEANATSTPAGAPKAKASPTPAGAPEAKANPTPKDAPKAKANPTPKGAPKAKAKARSTRRRQQPDEGELTPQELEHVRMCQQMIRRNLEQGTCMTFDELKAHLLSKRQENDAFELTVYWSRSAAGLKYKGAVNKPQIVYYVFQGAPQVRGSWNICMSAAFIAAHELVSFTRAQYVLYSYLSCDWYGLVNFT